MRRLFLEQLYPAREVEKPPYLLQPMGLSLLWSRREGTLISIRRGAGNGSLSQRCSCFVLSVDKRKYLTM